MMENKTNCVGIEFSSNFFPPVYIIVFICGLIGNIWGLKSIRENWTKFGNINIFALNLCVTDVCHLLTLPFLVSYYNSGKQWKFGQAFCKMIRFLFKMNLYGSIGFLTCISIYRYLGIVHTMRVNRRVTASHSIAVTLLVWTLVFFQSLPDVFFAKTQNNLSKCYDTTADEQIEDYLKYNTVSTVTGFVIPLIILLGCYGHVAFLLATEKNTAVPVKMKLKCLRLVVVLILLFVVCFIPYHVFRMFNLTIRIWERSSCFSWYASIFQANQVGQALACMNSALDPLVYFCSTDDPLKKFLHVCGERRSSSAPFNQAAKSPRQAVGHRAEEP